MGMFLNRGTEEFECVLDSEIYIDKTDMISFFNRILRTEQRYACVSRPRRFGKSITANMIAAYYEKGSDSRSLFEGRKLSRLVSDEKDFHVMEEKQLEESPWKERKDEFTPYDWEKNLNKYDVIRIDVAGVRSAYETPEETLDFIIEKVCEELKEAFPDVDCNRYHEIGNVLAEINDKKGTKFIIIIDEWDTFFRDEKANQALQTRYINLLRSLFKDNRSKKFTALAYITGILPIKKYNSESALNNFIEYTMITPDRLEPYIGFREEEVKELCEQYGMDFEQARAWYDGYYFERVGHIYSPNSIVRAMLSHRYDNYWSQTVAFNSLRTYITMNFDGLKDSIVAMLGNAKVPVEVSFFQNDMVNFQSKDDVLTVLIHLGYLAYDKETESAYIPNYEVRQIFEKNIEQTGWQDIIDRISDSENLLEATINREADVVAQAVEACHMENVSILKYNDENALSCVITLAYYTARKNYAVIREFPTGKGFADLVFIPKPGVEAPAMIIELKWNDTADTAIRQIKENRYASGIKELKGYKGKLLLVGISYEKAKRGEKSKEHDCVIEEVEWERGKSDGIFSDVCGNEE